VNRCQREQQDASLHRQAITLDASWVQGAMRIAVHSLENSMTTLARMTELSVAKLVELEKIEDE
jgi:hypothetical protein